MKLLKRTANTERYPERVIQFGAGNFIRAFVDYMIQELNQKTSFNSGVIAVKPTDKGSYDTLKLQEGLFTLFLQGIKNGKGIREHTIIDCIQRSIDPYIEHSEYMAIAEIPDVRFVFSNTTEAGIAYEPDETLGDAPQKSFPGKLTALLYKRFEFFSGATDKGLIIIPCELIDKNGDTLRKIILQYAKDWKLSEDFVHWVQAHNVFCNTLVDRIVPGYPREKMDSITQELGYIDNLVVEGEQFHLWVIEGPKTVSEEFPAVECGLNVVFTDNIDPYRTRKVRILNGAHTALVPVGYLYGIDKVRESLEDPIVGSFLKDAIFKEICPTLDLSQAELIQFSNDVLDRFGNPFLEHELISISLNSVSKYKTRVLPSVMEYIKRRNALPKRLLFSLAALIVFYKGKRNEEHIPLNDDPKVLNFFKNSWGTGDIGEVSHAVLSNIGFWQTDLTLIEGLEPLVTKYIRGIWENGIQAYLSVINKEF